MNKFILLFIIACPLFTYSQSQYENNEVCRIFLKNGRVLECIIQSKDNDKVVFTDRWGLNTSTLSLKEIREIKKTSNSSQNDELNYPVTLTTGDHLIKAGSNYLFSFGLSVAGGALISIDPDNIDLIRVGSVMVAGGVICTIIGHIQLIKAGKSLNKEKKISFKPASSGIGLAINF